MALQRLEECVIAHLHDMGFKRAAQISDFLMPETLEVRDCQFHPFLVVDSDVSDGRIVMDLVVVEHRRGAGRPKVCHPGIVQGKSENKRGGIIVLQHEHVIRLRTLGLCVHRNYFHLISFRFRHLPEAHYDVIGKMMGLLVLDEILLDEDAQTFR